MNVWAKIPSGQPSTVRYSMEELINIWDDANDPHWENIRQEVADIYGSTSQKYWQFFNRGTDAGVRH